MWQEISKKTNYSTNLMTMKVFKAYHNLIISNLFTTERLKLNAETFFFILWNLFTERGYETHI